MQDVNLVDNQDFGEVHQALRRRFSGDDIPLLRRAHQHRRSFQGWQRHFDVAGHLQHLSRGVEPAADLPE